MSAPPVPPTPPSTSDPANFASRADAWVAWEQQLYAWIASSNFVDKDCFQADRNNSNQTGLSSAAISKVQFNNEVFDTGAWYDPVTNFRFTPLRAGKWRVTVSVMTATGTSGETCQAHIRKNGTTVKLGNTANASSASTFQSIASAIVSMNGTTDYLEAFAYVPTAVTVINGSIGTTYFEAEYISS